MCGAVTKNFSDAPSLLRVLDIPLPSPKVADTIRGDQATLKRSVEF